MKKNLLISLALVAFCLSSWASVTITPQMAVNIVKQHRTATENQRADFYAGVVTGLVNDSSLCVVPSMPDESWAVNGEDMLLVYVDEQPLRLQSYQCKYYYLPAEVSSLADVPYLCYDGVRFPAGLHLTGIDIKPATGLQAIDVAECNFASLNPQLAPGAGQATNTKAILISTQEDTPKRNTAIWNGVAAMYTFLTQSVGIPKSDIFLNLSFKNYAPMMLDENGNEVAMSLDLDGDGIEESCLTDSEIGTSLSALLANNEQGTIDHLFIVDDYQTRPRPYQSGYSELSAGFGISDLKDSLNILLPKYTTLLLTSFTSKEALDEFSEYSHIVTSAGETGYIYQSELDTLDVPMNPFLYRWLCAMNGEDILPEDEQVAVIDADTDYDGYVSMYEAYAYARQGSGGWYAPSFYAQPELAGSQLAFNRPIPYTRLYVGKHSAGDSTIVTWNSPDIWLVNSPESTSLEQEAVRLTASNNQPYIRVRVSNEGGLEFNNGCGDRYLYLYYKINELGRNADNPYDLSENTAQYLANIHIDSIIPANGSVIIDFPCYPAGLLTDISNGIPNITVFAEISGDVNREIPTPYRAQKSLVRFAPTSGVPKIYHSNTPPYYSETYFETTIPVLVRSEGDITSLGILPDNATIKTLQAGKLFLDLPGDLCGSLTQGNSSVQRDSSNPCRFRLLDANAKITGLSYEPGRSDTIKFICQRNEIDLFNSYSDSLHLVAYNADTLINGLGIRMDYTASSTGPIIIIVPGFNGTTRLTAGNTGDGDVCNWYKDGNQSLGQGQSIQIDSNQADGYVLLTVEQPQTGQTGFAVADLSNAVTIQNATITSCNTMGITLSRPSAKPCDLIAASALTGQIIGQARIPASEQETSLVLSNYHGGPVVVTLSCDGEQVHSVQVSN